MRVIKSLAVSLALMLGCLTAAFAQNQREVSGKVLDAAQQPLVGVAVIVDGTSNGTMTSENGTFSLMVPMSPLRCPPLAMPQRKCLSPLHRHLSLSSWRKIT